MNEDLIIYLLLGSHSAKHPSIKRFRLHSALKEYKMPEGHSAPLIFKFCYLSSSTFFPRRDKVTRNICGK